MCFELLQYESGSWKWISFRHSRFILGDVQPHYECAPLLIPRTQAPVTSCHRLVLKKKTMSNFEEFTVSNRMKSKFDNFANLRIWDVLTVLTLSLTSLTYSLILTSHYSKSQIFVQKFNFDKSTTFSRVFHPKFLTIFLV